MKHIHYVRIFHFLQECRWVLHYLTYDQVPRVMKAIAIPKLHIFAKAYRPTNPNTPEVI